MSLFAYEAVDAEGRRHRGEIEADSERNARQQIKSKQWIVRNLQPLAAKESSKTVSDRRLSASETTLFLQQIATLTTSGMPLTEALASIVEGMESRRGRRSVAAIRQHILEGGSLADALRRQHMDEVVCNMVEAGEETGQLGAVASRLADLMEHRQQMRQELMSATLYPAIILGFGIIVMLFLLAVVVPQVVSVFQHTGGTLPMLTKVVIALSAFLRDHGLLLSLIVIGLVIAYRVAMRNETIRAKRDAVLLRLPLLSGVLAKIDAARFSRTLGMLLAGGVPALNAIHIANQSFGMAPLRETGKEARDALREGGSLAASFRKSGLMPFLAVRMMEIGEQSGTLDSMLLKIAETFERETSRSLKRMLTIIEPTLVLLMAVLVGALAMAILLPIVEMNELIH